MKISVFGMLPFSNLIKEGFTKLGHEISDEDPELIYYSLLKPFQAAW